MASHREHIIFADLDPSEAVLLNMRTKNYYRLNETGQVIWKCLDTGMDPASIARKLCEDYEIDDATALSDVATLIERLKLEAILDDSEASTSFSIEKAHQSKLGKTPL